MSRVARQASPLYLGLFVVFFALFARERQQRLAGVAGGLSAAVVPSSKTPSAPASVSERIAELSRILQNDSLFQVHADGLRASYALDSVTISFYGDEVLPEGGFAFREEWYTALDRVAELLKPFLQKGLRIEVIGSTDIGSARERRPTDYGESDYALSFARAEWVGRFLERRALIPLRDRVKLTGAGSAQSGRRVDLRLTFGLD